MTDTRIIDALIRSIDLHVRRQHKEDQGLVLQRTLQCYRFHLPANERIKILESATDPTPPVLDDRNRNTSLTPEEEKEEEEKNSSDDLLEDDADAIDDEKPPPVRGFDVSRYKAGFEADWDYASRLVRDCTLGFFLHELAPAVTYVLQKGNSSPAHNNGYKPHQIKRLGCVSRPVKKFGLVYDRIYPIAGQKASKKSGASKTRVIPIHLIPIFFAAQTPKIHAYNATIPICYQLIQKMEAVRFNYENDQLFLCCLEQLKANTARVARMHESKADSIVAYNNQLTLIDRQLSKMHGMIDESKVNCNLADRFVDIEARLGALEESKSQQDAASLLEERLNALEKTQKTMNTLLRRHHTELKGKKRQRQETKSDSDSEAPSPKKAKKED